MAVACQNSCSVPWVLASLRVYDHRFVVCVISLFGVHSTAFKHIRLPERSFLALVLFAFSLVQVVGFVESVWGLFGESAAYTVSYALEIWLPRLLYPLMAIFVIAQSGRNFIQGNNLINISVVGVLLVGAIQAGTQNISPAIFAALFFVVWINQWMPNPSGDGLIWFDRYVAPALLIYLIAPIVFLCMLHLVGITSNLTGRFEFLIDRTSNDGLFRGESFRGFARDRIAYSFLCGITFLYLLAERRLNVRNLIYLGLLLIALSMAGSRAALIALIVAVCYLGGASKISGLFVFVAGLAVLVAAAFISGRPDFFGDPGDRTSIFLAYVGHVLINPVVLLVGEGRFGAEILLGSGAHVRPHSWPLNSLINFGLFATAAWMVFLYGFYEKLNTAGRSILIYFITVGFFHNGFDAYFFSMEQLLAFLFAMTLGMKASRPLFFASRNGRRNGAPHSRKDPYESNPF